MSWRVLIVAAVAAAVCAFPHGGENTTSTGPLQLINSLGYPAELHHVTTPDGYILGVHRIPYGRAGPTAGRRPVVFLMHGLMGASTNFIGLGAENSIAFNLADAGYDVWMGNARGNIYSRAHVSLDPDHSTQKNQFFDFSWEEIGMIDVSSMIDYALSVTGETRVHYIGHSQGGTSFLVLNSMRTEYNQKFLSAHLLAGVGYMEYFPTAQLRAAALITNSLYALGTSLGLVEISNIDDLPFDIVRSSANDVTKQFYDVIGVDIVRGQRDSGIEIGGAALKQFAHYGQNIRDKTFRRWDYGFIGNRQTYGSINPPSYDLTLITVPTTMHYTVSDTLLDERDVLAMASVMPNTEPRKVARESFSHVDFVAAYDAKELVTDYIIESIGASEKLAS